MTRSLDNRQTRRSPLGFRRRPLRAALLVSVILTFIGAVPAAGADPGTRAMVAAPGPLADGHYLSVRSGISQERVRFVQRRIGRSGFRVRVDGVFGTETETAVRRFQVARRLLVDGIVGRQTMAALSKHEGRARGAAEHRRRPVRGSQSRLESRRGGRRRGRAGRDRDRDRLPDRWERRYGLSTRKKNADGDPDRDRVDNGSEYRARLHPRRRDTDRDGRPDGREDADRDRLTNAAEDRTGNDPIDPDSDDDGVRDGAEGAGKVLSFQGDILVIDRVNGGRLSARLTEDTGLDCVDEDDASGAEPPEDSDAGDEADDDADDGLDDEFAGEGDEDEEGGDDVDPCLRELVRGAPVRSSELDEESGGSDWGEVEVVE